MDMIILGGVFFLVGVILFIIAFVRDEGWSVSVGAFLLVGASLLFMVIGSSEVRFRAVLEEVDLRKVSIVGQDQFNAQIKIIYQNGKLLSVTLVPKTTVKVAGEEVEKK